MSENDNCPLTGRICWRLDFNESRCSDSPAIEEVSNCISDLVQHKGDLDAELTVMDMMVERLKEQIKDAATAITKH